MAEETVSAEEHLQNVIKKIATEQNFKNFDIKITPVSTNGANYTSTLFKVKITGEGRELDVFAKVAALNEKIRVETKFNPFDIETEFYTNLTKTFRQLEEKHGVSDRDKIKFSAFYGVDMTYLQEILVLEDLTSRGFGSANRFESVDWSYASAAITELAKFHALSIAIQHENPEDFDTYINKIPGYIYEDNTGMEAIFQGGVASALAAVREENKEKLSIYLQRGDPLEIFKDLYKPGKRKVITHTDFRPNNMLHKVSDDGSTEVIPVDYQTLQPGSPVVDLLYFIITATDGPFREKYYQKLIDHYYSELGVALQRLGLNVADKFSRTDFESELREKLPYGLMMSIALLPILVVPEDSAPVIGDDFSSLAVNATSELYAQRLNAVVDDYVRWGVLSDSKETMSNEDHLHNFIKKIATEQNFKNFDIKITPVSTNGANYTSTLFKVKITGEGRELDVFAKVAALNEKIRAETKFNPFEIETEFYTNLIKTYKELENNHDVPDKDRLKFPVYYGSETTHLREILLLEDLTSRGFGSANRFESVDWSYASAAITELAKFHALSIAFQHEHTEDFDTYLKKIPENIYDDNSTMDLIIQGGVASALAAVREENKDKLSTFLQSDNSLESFQSLYKPGKRKVITHTDFRPNNMLHKVMNDGSTEVIPVDYQTVQPGSPIIDLLYFIFTATDGPFREKYYQKLIDHYHSELSVALERLGLNIADKFSKTDFESELREKLPFGLVISIVILPIVVVPEDSAPVIGDDFASMAIKATSELYGRRLNEVVDDYVKWGVLKDSKETVSAEEHLQNFIKKIATEQNFNSFDIKITPVSTNGASYTSTLFKVQITGEGRELDIFAKVAALSQKIRGQSNFDPFEMEYEFYTKLIKTYKQLENKYGVPDKDRLKFPIYYGAETTHLREILVLEDLTSRGYGSPNRFESVDWPYAAAAITELAKFHALSLAFQHESPNDFEDFSTKMSRGIFEDNVDIELLFQGGTASALAAVRKDNEDKLNVFLKRKDIFKSFNEFYKPINCKVITHTDFRPSNMLHKVINDEITDVIPVDYQTLQLGSPIIDLLNFIFTATDGPFRAKYYEKLINHYYSEFSAALTRLGLNVAHTFPRESFEAELKEKLPYGLILMIGFLPILVVPEDKAPVLGDDFTSMSMSATSDVYTRRLNEVMDDYVRWGVLGDSGNSQIQSLSVTLGEKISAEEHLLNFVNKIATEQNFTSFETFITPVSTHGANYTSTLFKIKIVGEERDLKIFAKVAALNEKLRAQTSFNPFEVETKFYTKLAKTYRKLEKKHGVPDKTSLRFPVYYGAESTHLREILILEDLTSREFRLPNRFESVDWSYASAAITELAKFHALSIAFQHESPSDFEKFIKKIPGGIFEDNVEVQPLFKGGMASALAAVRKENKDKLNVFFKRQDILELFNELYKPVNRKVIIHADFRPNNMLHKVRNDGSTEVIPVDYQTLQPGSPVIDLLYFIFAATDGPFRAKYYQKLINHYYSQLSFALARFGLSAAHKFSRKDFESELKQKLPYGLIVSVVMLPVLLVPEDKAPQIGGDISSMVVNATSDLYSRRLNEAVDDFVSWGVLGRKNNSCFRKCLF